MTLTPQQFIAKSKAAVGHGRSRRRLAKASDAGFEDRRDCNMHRALVASTVGTFALLFAGCGGDTTAAKKVEEAKVKVDEAARATWEAAKAKRDEFVVQANQQLQQLDGKYEALKVKAADAAEDAKPHLEKLVEEAKVKREQAAKKLEELNAAGADRWEKVKVGVSDAMNDLKKAFE